MVKLKNVFGIQFIDPAIKTDKDIDAIRAAALHVMLQAHSQGIHLRIFGAKIDKTFEYDTHGLNHAVEERHLLI